MDLLTKTFLLLDRKFMRAGTITILMALPTNSSTGTIDSSAQALAPASWEK
jgi:hypothetical protein